MIRRFTTTKRLESAVPRRCRCTWANIRCEVEEPMSMPTVVSSTLSAAQATSLTESSTALTCRCSNSRSCMVCEDARERALGASGRRLGVSALVDELGHARGHAVFAELLEIDAVNARVLVRVFDLAAAVLAAHVHAEEHVALAGG